MYVALSTSPSARRVREPRSRGSRGARAAATAQARAAAGCAARSARARSSRSRRAGSAGSRRATGLELRRAADEGWETIVPVVPIGDPLRHAQTPSSRPRARRRWSAAQFSECGRYGCRDHARQPGVEIERGPRTAGLSTPAGCGNCGLAPVLHRWWMYHGTGISDREHERDRERRQRRPTSSAIAAAATVQSAQARTSCAAPSATPSADA